VPGGGGGNALSIFPSPEYLGKKSELEEGGSTPKIKIKNVKYFSQIILLA
jgi:hypothetical protein